MTLSRRKSEAGAALITVLLIVGAMSAVAVSLTHGLTESVKRSRALEGQAQLRLLAVAAEELAESRLTALVVENGAELTAEFPGFAEPIRLPLEGGILEITVSDASNCFDMNQLASVDPDTESPAEGASSPDEDLQLILTSIDLDPGTSLELVAGVADWIDIDLAARLGGAEDGYYTQLRPPYRTSGLPLEADSELRAIRGFEPDVLAQIADVVCVIPSHADIADRRLNINTLRPDQAALLVPVFSDAVRTEELRQLIASRPLGGWASVEDFLGDPSLTTLSPDIIRTSKVTTVSSFVAIRARVAYAGQAMVMSYLFELKPGSRARLLRRERVS